MLGSISLDEVLFHLRVPFQHGVEAVPLRLIHLQTHPRRDAFAATSDQIQALKIQETGIRIRNGNTDPRSRVSGGEQGAPAKVLQQAPRFTAHSRRISRRVGKRRIRASWTTRRIDGDCGGNHDSRVRPPSVRRNVREPMTGKLRARRPKGKWI